MTALFFELAGSEWQAKITLATWNTQTVFDRSVVKLHAGGGAE